MTSVRSGRPSIQSLVGTWVTGPEAGRLPRVLSIGTSRPVNEAFDSYVLNTELVFMVTEGPLLVRQSEHEFIAKPGDVVITRAGERHGWAQYDRKPSLQWQLYFTADGQTRRDCPVLGQPLGQRRVVHLERHQVEAFHAQFVNLYMELHQGRPGSEPASSAMLTMLLVTVGRWATGGYYEEPQPAPQHADAEVLEFWRRLHAAAASDGESLTLGVSVPRYDSLRHRFKRTFGESPRRVWQRLQMQRAQRLLLEAGLTLGEIAKRIGYARQHEFSRAFHREIGSTPSAWRDREAAARRIFGRHK